MRTRLYLIVIMAIVSLSASAHSVVRHRGYYEVSHTWECDGEQYSITINVSKNLYDYYQNDREHLSYIYHFNDASVSPNYYSFMISEHSRSLMQTLTNELSEYANSEAEQVNLALTFVQSLPYVSDEETKGTDEYVRYPVETLVDGCGDCEDKVALLSAMLYEMDIDFILLSLPKHMAVGVHCEGVKANSMLFREKEYYYLETTMPDWKMGQIPKYYSNAKVQVLPFDDTPSVLIKGVRFESQPNPVDQKANCDLQVNLHNLGPGKVTELKAHIRVVMKGESNIVLADQWYSLADLAEGEARTEKLSLNSLIKENSYLEVKLIGAEMITDTYSVGLNYSQVGN